MADAADSKSAGGNIVRVRVPFPAVRIRSSIKDVWEVKSCASFFVIAM